MRITICSLALLVLVLMPSIASVQALIIGGEVTPITVDWTPPPPPPSQTKIIVQCGRAATQNFLASVQAYAASNTETAAANVFVSAAQLQDSLHQFVDYLQALWPDLTKVEREWYERTFAEYITYLTVLADTATTVFTSEESIVHAEFTVAVEKETGEVYNVTFNYVQIS